MSEYKGIKGFGVQTLATDPDNTSWIGSIFYNSTSGTFKVVKQGVGSWASGTNMPFNSYGLSAAGTLTAGIAIGGTFQPTDTTLTTTTLYDGTTWTSAPSTPVGNRYGAAWGTQTSAVQVGGSTTPAATPLQGSAQEFTGTWSSGGSLNTARRFNGAAGDSTTAGITFGGGDPGTTAITESYNGTAWTEVNDLNTAGYRGFGTGTSTSAIFVDGTNRPGLNELWNGTSWTESTGLNTARGGDGGIGTATIAVVSNGSPVATEQWNGTSWTEVNDMATARGSGWSTGSNSVSNGFYVGGTPNSFANYTEEWVLTDFTINTLTTS